MLSLNELTEHADCVLPVDNQALFDIVSRIDARYAQKGGGQKQEQEIKDGTSVVEAGNKK